jgi:cytochrome c oxidase subunit 2
MTALPQLAGHPAQDALNAAGIQAAHVENLWWLMFWICALAFAATMIALAWALLRARRADRRDEARVSPEGERRLTQLVSGGLAVVTVLLGVMFFASIFTDRALARLPLEDAVHIELTGYQWWWEATYDDPTPSNMFTTANELHIPVGRPVMLTLRASDVIHSLWIPNLAGKKDLIPGRTNTLALRADAPGVFRAQCAEFCGWQHANMALLVVAEAPADFQKWVDGQRSPAPEPSDDKSRHGREVFEKGTCAMCHAIKGTNANATRGPDLTHVASRRTLGAGTIPNTAAHRAAWVGNAPAIKPGTNMPPQPLPPADFDALLAYLGTLQ